MFWEVKNRCYHHSNIQLWSTVANRLHPQFHQDFVDATMNLPETPLHLMLTFLLMSKIASAIFLSWIITIYPHRIFLSILNSSFVLGLYLCCQSKWYSQMISAVANIDFDITRKFWKIWSVTKLTKDGRNKRNEQNKHFCFLITYDQTSHQQAQTHLYNILISKRVWHAG